MVDKEIESGLLRLPWVADEAISIDVVSHFSRALERAYNQTWLFQNVPAKEFRLKFEPRPRVSQKKSKARTASELTRGFEGPESPLGRGALGRYAVPIQKRLVLKSVVIQSPGFWEVIGDLNPLEVIRKYLQDRHVRRQDRAYRETEEAARLSLENQAQELENFERATRISLLENEVVAGRIVLLRRAKVPEEAIQRAVQGMLTQPLRSLGRYQDDGLLGRPELKDSTDGEGRT